MTPDEIVEAYKVVTQDIENRAATEAARVGNAQRSLGTLAERVASPSGQTSGLANYTYDRTMRPTVDSLAAALTTQGYANALENNLKAGLREAKNRYDDARNAYTAKGGSGGSGGGSGGGNKTSGATDKDDAEFRVGEVRYQNQYVPWGSTYYQWEAAKQWAAQNAQRQAVYDTLKQKYENGEITAEEYNRALERMVNGY